VRIAVRSLAGIAQFARRRERVRLSRLLCLAAGVLAGPAHASAPAPLTLRHSRLALDGAHHEAVGSARPEGAIRVPTDYIFGGGFDPPIPFASDQPFSVMWYAGDRNMHRAAVRADGSIADTDDFSIAIAHVAVGRYCMVVPIRPSEGVVGVLQNAGATHGTIDVTMGVQPNPCSQEPDASVIVQTWQLP
jgi:hypothetical protein